MLDKYTIDRIYDRAQIVDVVSDFVTLKKRGVNFVGLCPFHDDSTPSFYVSPSKNICKCFACGEGGTAIQFIMKHEQSSYYEALRYLAKKYFIEINERELSDDEKQMQSDRESMMIVNSWAQKFFTSRLNEHNEGRTIGLTYFVERGFREDVIRKFQLGYSLRARNDLHKSALGQGYNEKYLLKTGLVYQRDDGFVADRFHDRVIFPVHSLSGKVVAFGGRILGKKDKIAKYVNSPESEVYRKSYELYGIFFAKQAIVKADKCYLVEGYTDVISMHQTGIENVVASSGTSLTLGQIRLIRRFTVNITVIYDGDAAGIKAAIRGIDMLLEEGMNVKIVLLPEGEDPDSYARSHNSFDFTLYIQEHEVDFIRFKANLLLKDAGNDPMKRAALIKEIMESVALIPDNLVRSVYIRECSQQLDEREQVLIDEVIKIRNRRKNATQLIKEREQRAMQQALQEQVSSSSESHETPRSPASAESPETSESPVSAELSETTGPSKEVAEKVPVNNVQITRKQYPFSKFESALIRYVIRYGERVLFIKNDTTDDEHTPIHIKVADYIRSELTLDDIDIQTPIYKQILDEAVARYDDNTFVASHYFLSHTDLEISKIATNMMTSKYQLSKFFDDHNEVALRQATLTEEQQKVENEAIKKEKERELLERWLVMGLFELKNAHIRHEINEINKQFKSAQSDEEKTTLLKKRMELDKVKCLLSNELGGRVVTGISR